MRKMGMPQGEYLSKGHASLAHLVEQLFCNQQVAGSSPAGGSAHYLPTWKPLYRKVMAYENRRQDTLRARVIVVVAAGTKSVKCYGSTAVSNTASLGSTPSTLAKLL